MDGVYLKNLIGPDFIHFESNVLWVYSASIVRVLTLLSTHHALDFKQLMDITAIDYPARPERFEIVYHLLSLSQNQRLMVKLSVDETTHVPTVTSAFVNANWYEREIWDLFGIVFSNHPDLRRILTDYNFAGHPLRKDFPVTGYTQVRYCPEAEKVIYEPLQLEQPYRHFDFLSPHQGTTPYQHPVKPNAPDLLP